MRWVAREDRERCGRTLAGDPHGIGFHDLALSDPKLVCSGVSSGCLEEDRIANLQPVDVAHRCAVTGSVTRDDGVTRTAGNGGARPEPETASKRRVADTHHQWLLHTDRWQRQHTKRGPGSELFLWGGDSVAACRKGLCGQNDEGCRRDEGKRNGESRGALHIAILARNSAIVTNDSVGNLVRLLDASGDSDASVTRTRKVDVR